MIYVDHHYKLNINEHMIFLVTETLSLCRKFALLLALEKNIKCLASISQHQGLHHRLVDFKTSISPTGFLPPLYHLLS